MIGQKLGHYRVLEKIGSGGMGEVYRAYDEQLDRDVAVKVLPPGTLADETARKRFRKEALALAKLNHPNIETVHEFDTQDGVDFLVMEMIPGQTLAQKLKSGPLANPEILRLGLQVADGLAAAHAQGVVHRDLKPGNLIVMPDGRLKILDFGLARLLRPVEGVDATQSVTETQAISGTLPYMSPEQLRGDPIDARSDIYSAGAVLYEMATGQRPFPELHAPRLIDSILHQTPLPPSKANLRVPPTLESIILKALDKEPAHRYQSARELHAVLEALATGVVPIASRQRLLALAGASALALFILLGVSLGLNVGRLRDRLTGRLNPSKGGFASSSVPVQTRRSVAVLGFKNVSGRPDAAWLSTGLSEMFTTELGAGEKLRTISEENVARAKMDLLLSDADSLAKDTLTRVRKNLGTDFVVLGSYVHLGKEAGGQIRVDLRLQDARDGETIATVSVMGTENQLFDLVSKAGSQLREKLGLGAISEAEASGVRASLPSDPEAARLYAEGLAKLRVFDALAARELLQKAVAADPNYALAHSALAAAWSALGYDGKSVEEARKAFDLSANLSREDRLAIEGRYREATKDWLKAIDVYHTLWTFFPDNLDYGLRLVAAQTSAGQAKDALATIEALHKLAPPASDDARIDLAVEAAARGLSDFRRELSAASNAAAKGAAQSARLLVAGAKLAEGRSYFSLGEMKKSQAASEEAKRIFAEAGDRSGEATALHNIANVLSHEGDNAGAKKLEGEVLATCRKIGNKRCMADALNSIGIILKDTADFPTAQRTYEQSLALRREIGDRNGEAVSLNNIAVLLYEQGKLAAAKTMYEQSLEISREIGEKRGIVRALTNLSIVLQDQGDLAGARKMQEESLAIRREIADKVGVAIALNNLAVLLLYQGDIAGAKQRDDEQLAIEHETGKQRGLAYALFVQGEILAAQGHLAEARKAHEEALAIRSRLGERSTAAESRLSLAILSIEEDRPAEAEQPARDIRDQSRKEREPETEILAEVVLARSLLAQGKLTEAEKEINYAESASSRGENRRQQLAVAITAAHVHAATGNSAEAAKNLQITLAQSTRLGFVPYQFEARLALGEMEMKFGKTPAGRARLRALEKDATAKGFFLIARKAHAAASSQ